MVRRRTLTVTTSLLLVGTLFAAACGGDDDETETTDSEQTDGGDDDGGDKPDIKVVQNAWTASAVEAEIAKQLIESELGNSVEIVEIDENAMFTGLADGDLDFVLEIWPSGIDATEQAFLDDGTVVEVGDLGAVGQIGWFVPSYVLDEHPELATWEGFTDPDNAKLFATASTGDQGRFLGTDPSYSEYDAAIIENLDLPLVVEYSGSEATTVAELDTRVAAEEPILMYWWTPTAAVAKYDLQLVELPPYSDECYEVAEDVDCAYPADQLKKLASGGLAEKDPAVYSFVENFTLSNDDQLGLLPAIEIDGEPAADIAAQWIADNEDIWGPWFE
jgi:glycine betaine/proline transport system substrate-binding protein